MRTVQQAFAVPFPAAYVRRLERGPGADYVPWTTIAQALIVAAGPFDWVDVTVTYSPGGNQVTVGGTLVTYREDGRIVRTAAVNYDEAYTDSKGEVHSPNPASAESRALARAAAKQGLGLSVWCDEANGKPYFLAAKLDEHSEDAA